MPIFDTHAHYDDSRFDADRDALLSALPDAGVGLVLDPGCDIPSSQAAAVLSERYSHVYAAAGIHPEECGGFHEGELDTLRELLSRPKVWPWARSASTTTGRKIRLGSFKKQCSASSLRWRRS